jgi:hypothetical protein
LSLVSVVNPSEHRPPMWLLVFPLVLENVNNNNNSYIGHSAHTSESANVEAQKSVICTINSTHRIAATLYTLESWFVSGI